jgi:diadenosine tetraphosphate (Ap4A) HIT family hydrolase
MQNEPVFQLHPRILADSIAVGHFDLCQLRMQNDSQHPWFILIPERCEMTEIYQLSVADQQQLAIESSYLAEQLARGFQADKMNIAAIGNLVPQLHIHHIVRFKTDQAWPAPVWGKYPTQPYSETARAERVTLIQKLLSPFKNFSSQKTQ